MNRSVHQLIYLSRDTTGDAAGVQAQELERILAVSRRNNERDGITGALLHGSGYFAQALEGGLSVLEQTFERIQCDARHGEVVILHCMQVPQRAFSRWSMANAGVLTPQAAARLRLEEFGNPDPFLAERVLIQLRDLLRLECPQHS